MSFFLLHAFPSFYVYLPLVTQLLSFCVIRSVFIYTKLGPPVLKASYGIPWRGYIIIYISIHIGLHRHDVPQNTELITNLAFK